MNLELNKTPYLGPLTRQEQKLVQRIIKGIEDEVFSKHIKSRALEIFNNFIGCNRWILVAKQGVPFIYLFQGISDVIGTPLPEISVVTVNRYASDYYYDEVEDIFDPTNPGKKLLIDDVAFKGLTARYLLKFAEKLDSESQYYFRAFYNKHIRVPWDTTNYYFGLIPYDSSIQGHEYLSRSQHTNRDNMKWKVFGVRKAQPNGNISELIIASHIAQELYSLGREAGEDYLNLQSQEA